MKCREVQILLTEDLSNSSQGEVQDHLKGCLECCQLHELLEEIAELHTSLSRSTPVPADFTGKIMSEVGKQPRRPAYFGYVAAFVALAALVVGFGWERVGRSPSQDAVGVSKVQAHPVSLDSVGLDSESNSYYANIGPSTLEQGAPSFVEVLVTDPSGKTYIVRIPSKIHVRQTSLQHEYLSFVSH